MTQLSGLPKSPLLDLLSIENDEFGMGNVGEVLSSKLWVGRRGDLGE